MGYDAKCETLARAFLADEFNDPLPMAEVNRLTAALAQAIQDAIEAWLQDYRQERSGE